MNTQERVYLDAQAACGLKVGDWVSVNGHVEHGDGGWQGHWSPDKTKLIGRSGIVMLIDHTGIGVKFDFDPNGVWMFPYFVLKKVEKPTHKFKPFERVLVRDRVGEIWRPDLFGLYTIERVLLSDPERPFQCIGDSWRMCIPYAGNEHLVGTAEDPE